MLSSKKVIYKSLILDNEYLLSINDKYGIVELWRIYKERSTDKYLSAIMTQLKTMKSTLILIAKKLLYWREKYEF